MTKIVMSLIVITFITCKGQQQPKKSQWKVDTIGYKAKNNNSKANLAFTDKNISKCFECLFIGYDAGSSSYNKPVKYAIVIGDHFKTKAVKDYDIIIDKDWWYFKTKDGKREYIYIMGFVNISAFYYGTPEYENEYLQNRNKQLKYYIGWKIIPQIKKHYDTSK